MNFDNLINEFEKSQNQERVNATPDIVKETFAYGNDLIDVDYLPQIKDVELIKKFIVNYEQMNLYKRGWRFSYGNSKSWAGLCSIEDVSKTKNKNIYVSIQVTKHDRNWKENMRDVILHEIAHAIIFEIFYFDKSVGTAELHRLDDLHKASAGHGLVFKAVCAAIDGGDGCRINYEKASYKDSFKNYKYDCSFCGHSAYGDYPKFTELCSECKKPVIVEANIS